MKKYLHIKEAILGDINARRLKVGDQLPVREELIKQYNVSRATLNKAIAELIQEGRLVAYRNRGTFVAPKSKKLKAVLVANFRADLVVRESRFFSPWQEALQHVIISTFSGKVDLLDERKAEQNLGKLSEYDAVIWVMPTDTMLKRLDILKHKVILVNRYSEGFSFVSTNHRQAMYDMTLHFIRKFGEECYLTYLDVEDSEFICSERREGFITACEENGKFYRFVRLGGTFEKNTEILMKLEFKPGKKNVLISPSHKVTGSVLRMAYLRGLMIEKDFFYSDFDNADSLMHTGIQIPSIIQDYQQMGEEAIKIAESPDHEGVSLFIPHTLVNL